MTYHPLVTKCPRCQLCVDTNEVSFRLDRMIMIEGTCPQCKALVYQEFTLGEVMDTIVRLENPHSPEFDLAHYEVKGRPS